MERLGRNHGRYLGETVDIDAVLVATEQTARQEGWEVGHLPVREGLELLTLQRGPPAETAARRIYISSGIHGDEPAGPMAVQRLVADRAWPEDLAVWICPCLNPAGFRLNRRENEAGTDLNRDYRHLRSDLVRCHVSWLESLPRFDCTICLHEDWEAVGFYLYELNPSDRPSLAREVIEQVKPICPIDLSPEIEGREAREGIIRPHLAPNSRPEWPEAFYLITHKTALSYTLEAPSDFPMAMRVAALVAGVEVIRGFKPGT